MFFKWFFMLNSMSLVSKLYDNFEFFVRCLVSQVFKSKSCSSPSKKAYDIDLGMNEND